jgi:hypothetical protein
MLPSALTPFVRSDAVGAILAETFLASESELSIAEVARRADVLPAVAHNEVTRLLDGGVLVDRRDGRNRLVRVNTGHPLYPQMAEIIAATYGPVPVLRGLLEDMAGVEAAFIYGSWVARRSGEPGTPPRDLDVMAIGDLELDDMLAVQESGRDRLGVEVNVHRITAKDWRHPEGNPFLETVKSRPIVWLFGKESIE